MILKIRKKEFYDWVFFDGITKVEVSDPNDYAIVQKTDISDKNEYKYLEICGLTENCDKDGRRKIIDSSIFKVDECIWDDNEILSQKGTDDNGDKKYWGFKLLKLSSILSEKPYYIACFRWNEDVYLLNNEGKTIERL